MKGPTEAIETRIDPPFRIAILALLHRLGVNPEAEWSARLPPADPGASVPPENTERTFRDNELLETQQAHWSVWMRPRPARVSYGIDLTRALLEQMRTLATQNGAAFAMFRVDEFHPDPGRANNPRSNRGVIAVEHRGHWYVADAAQYRATVADLTRGFLYIPMAITVVRSRVSDRDGHLNLDGNRQVLGDLARKIAEGGLLPQ